MVVCVNISVNTVDGLTSGVVSTLTNAYRLTSPRMLTPPQTNLLTPNHILLLIPTNLSADTKTNFIVDTNTNFSVDIKTPVDTGDAKPHTPTIKIFFCAFF